MTKLLIVALSFLVVCGGAATANATCLLPSGFAGNDAAYKYAVAHINSLIYADMATNRLSTPIPTGKSAGGWAVFSERLTNNELAAKDLDCAAFEIGQQERFPTDPSDQFAAQQSEMARDMVQLARGVYVKLAEKAQAFNST